MIPDHFSGRILRAVAVLFIVLAGVSCSDNLNETLMPSNGTRLYITPSTHSAPELATDHLLPIGSTSTPVTIDVESNTRWSVEVKDCSGAWCSVAFPDGREVTVGDGEFTLQIAANQNTTLTRKCTVVIYAVDINHERVPDTSFEIRVEQDLQNVEVPDATRAELVAAGGSEVFEIISDQPWTASVNMPDWMTLSCSDEAVERDAQGALLYRPAVAGTTRKVSIAVAISRNLTLSRRRGLVTIASPTSSFTPIHIELTQSAAEDAFDVTPSTERTLSSDGGTLTFEVFSPANDWELLMPVAAPWLTADMTSGGPTQGTAVTLTVAPSAEYNTREAVVRFRVRDRDNTEIPVRITQDAAAPAVPGEAVTFSRPWLEAGWTQTAALFMSSLSVHVSAMPTECGAIIRRTDGGAETRVAGTLTGGLLRVELTGLEGMTQYDVWAYAIIDGELHLAPDLLRFTTAGLRPGEDDNPTVILPR
ncbi:MAG: hypothetical protein K2O24_01035 [Muribaculaceae bacterium]|nr:hypothetical protein [Muribaculaceae bacterium]